MTVSKEEKIDWMFYAEKNIYSINPSYYGC